ncbi:hypothetical protein BTA51_18710 [Hahella sp. CCB-MM4]|uniref:hypothetical protein n=1 Tax=Hahella sp. (strain CCB-MM4) TaxID=1926491 RepID=UPI000B9B5860|nr:hypothetical protein [Hahella sp. CCB-MM4]OZG71680.1 hypothetical protein BTA51_18710 [Hahella sp. CCB-MM4]
MQLLRRLKASKMNPIGPDVAKAPVMAFDLSGTELAFRCPPHELVGDDSTTLPPALNIYQDDIYEPWARVENIGMSAHLLYTGWKFWDRPFAEKAIGYVILDIHLTRRHPHYRKIDSLLRPSDMANWLLEYSDICWGGANKTKWENREYKDTPVIPELHFWRYPRSLDDIRQIDINGTRWFSYVADRPDGPKERIWNSPISDDHEVNFHFNPSALNREYYEPDHDLDGAVEKFVQEFMSHVHVKLAPDAQQRYDEVMAEVNQAG